MNLGQQTFLFCENSYYFIYPLWFYKWKYHKGNTQNKDVTKKHEASIDFFNALNQSQNFRVEKFHLNDSRYEVQDCTFQWLSSLSKYIISGPQRENG